MKLSRVLKTTSLMLVLAAALAAQAPQNALKITSQPGSAQVYLDDAPKGTTSPDEGKLVLENLPAGSHKLRIGLSGYRDWIQSVTLTEGSTIYVDAKLTVAGPPSLTSQDVVDLLKGGVSAKRAADLVKERGVDFALTDPLEKEIRAAGGDDALLLAVTKAKTPPPPSPPPAVPPTISLLEPAGAESGREIQATGSTLHVRGTASHPSGINSVSVNGQRAPVRTLSPQSVEFDAGDLPVGFGSTGLVVLATAADQSELRLIVKVARPNPVPPEPKPSAGPTPLTLEEIETALQNGLPNARIIGLVNQYGVNFKVTNDVAQRLGRHDGFTPGLLLAIDKAKRGNDSGAEVRVLEPSPGSEVAESAVKVRGLAVGFQDVEKVDVAGQSATLRRREDGSVEFEAARVPLAIGPNALQGYVLTRSGVRQDFKLELTRKVPPATR